MRKDTDNNNVTRGYTEEELKETITVTREELFTFEDDVDRIVMKWQPKAKKLGEFTKYKYPKIHD